MNMNPDKCESSNNGVHHVLNSLLSTGIGTHTVLVYPDLKTIREVYTNYVSANGKKKSELFVILPYYETVENVRNNIESNKNTSISRNESNINDSLIIRDCQDILGKDINQSNNFSLKIDTAVRNIVNFLNEMVIYAQKIGKNAVSVWIDTGAFQEYENYHHPLFTYEKSLPLVLKNTMIKQFCLYHQKDFEIRLNKLEESQVLDVHDSRYMLLTR
jgi:hypothetical protein